MLILFLLSIVCVLGFAMFIVGLIISEVYPIILGLLLLIPSLYIIDNKFNVKHTPKIVYHDKIETVYITDRQGITNVVGKNMILTNDEGWTKSVFLMTNQVYIPTNKFWYIGFTTIE